MKRTILRILVILLVISINIGCDQYTKHLAGKSLRGAGTVAVIGDYFVLRYAENRGAFLSIFSGMPKAIRILVLLILPAIALTWMTFFLIYSRTIPWRYLVPLSCLPGGGISNVMIDRLFNNGYVIDFMNIGIGNIRSGIFNFADLSIIIGCCAMLVYAFKRKSGSPQGNNTQQRRTTWN